MMLHHNNFLLFIIIPPVTDVRVMLKRVECEKSLVEKRRQGKTKNHLFDKVNKYKLLLIVSPP